MVLPCRNQSSTWRPAEQKEYQRILQQADELLWLSDDYYQGCMLMRNQYLVAHSSLCVCFLKDRKGGTAYTVAHAWRHGLEIRNLAVRN